MQAEIVERKSIAHALRESEAKFRDLMESAPDAIIVVDQDAHITLVNSQAEKMYGYNRDELIGQPIEILIPERLQKIHIQHRQNYISKPTARPMGIDLELVGRHKTGREFPLETSLSPLETEEGSFIISISRDITEKLQAKESIQQYADIVKNMQIGLYIYRLEQLDDDHTLQLIAVNPAAEKLTGLAKEEILNKTMDENFPTLRETDIPQLFADVVRMGKAIEIEDFYYGDERVIEGAWAFKAFPLPNNCVGVAFENITNRKQDEAKIQRQLQRLAALHSIDKAISGTLDLEITLNVVLEQATTQLEIDAADVLLLNPHTLTLGYAAGRGFHSDALQHTQLRLGEGYAGHAALERHPISISNLAEDVGDFERSPQLASEAFVAYYAMPLVAKGEVNGVLEIFHRKPLDPDPEWLDFLQTLAGQAAIAINNATLFDDLQRSNTELALAYDATLEGWVKALDLRDKETEGHTRRVAEMTVRLAQAMEMDEKELMDVRRGALLHDIGKMAIPDAILHKPDKLTQEEWEVIHKHPVYAYEWLSPISYLHQALDIPYCHHEKWDGTGYPRGLKGEEIPLAARIFALVDVWDALSSDRPYRKAWSKKKVVDYIREQSGTHFDPQVVAAFLDLFKEKSEHDGV